MSTTASLFLGKKSPKGNTAQIFWRKSPFSLKLNQLDCAPFKGSNCNKYAYWLHFECSWRKVLPITQIMAESVWGYWPLLQHFKSEKKKKTSPESLSHRSLIVFFLRISSWSLSGDHPWRHRKNHDNLW